MWMLKPLAKTLLHSGGALHGFRFRNRKAVRILMYHRFSTETNGLREQCEYILRYYQPVSLTTISTYIAEQKPLPDNALVITVDDGYRDFFLHAYPVLREYGIPAMVFLVSDFIDQKLWLWWNQLEYLVPRTSEKTIAITWPTGTEERFSLVTDQEKLNATQQIINGLIYLETEQRLALIAKITELLQVELPALPPPKWAAVTWHEVKEMASQGIEFGAHTRTHPILSRLPDRGSIREEIESSKLRIEEELHEPVIHFCYPNGSLKDFTQDAVCIVKEMGFQTAVTTERGMNTPKADPFLLRRMGVEPNGATPYFRELLAGVRVE